MTKLENFKEGSYVDVCMLPRSDKQMMGLTSDIHAVDSRASPLSRCTPQGTRNLALLVAATWKTINHNVSHSDTWEQSQYK